LLAGRERYTALRGRRGRKNGDAKVYARTACIS
jgi:hypothetical protein